MQEERKRWEREGKKGEARAWRVYVEEEEEEEEEQEERRREERQCGEIDSLASQQFNTTELLLHSSPYEMRSLSL